jgi:hypothetical protein
MTMSTASPFSGVLGRVLAQPTGGIVGLVDELLGACREHNLQLDWQADRYRVRSPGGDWDELPEPPLRKSVFRAVLARVAVLCNERKPDSVSPYGGEGEVSVGANPAAVFHVAFVNTPASQRLRLQGAIDPAVDTVLLHEDTQLSHKSAENGAGREAPPAR